MRGSRAVHAFALVAAGMLALPVGGPARAGTFTQVGTHPDAILQSSSTGKILATLHVFNGKIYAGYGDYGANSGPIGIRSFNPATNTFSNKLKSSATEALYIYRTIGGKCYGPHIDPLAGESSGGYALGVASGQNESWSDKMPVTAVHMFDVATWNGSDLWMVGAQGNNATAWRSTNGGTSWTVSLSLPPTHGISGDFARLYSVGAYNNKLYVQPIDYYGGDQNVSRVFDGTSWTTGPDLLPSGGSLPWHPEVFAGKMVYQTYHAGISASRMYQFDGTAATWLSSTYYYDYTISDSILYTLASTGLVQWTLDLVSWTTIGTAPSGSRSLAVLNRQLFIGGSQSQLYKYSLSVPEPATLALLGLGMLFALRRRSR